MERSKDQHRPLKFKTPEILQEKVNEYFAFCDANNRPYSIAQLAVYLDVDRQTIYNYEERDMFIDIIKKARERCIGYLEELTLKEGKGGQIFILKNYGYRDTQEITTIAKNITIDIEE